MNAPRRFNAFNESHSFMKGPFDSRQLQAFVILARTGSFTITAREMFLTQSAVSHSMKALENDAGCRLLDRVGKKVILTQAGEQLLKHAEVVLRSPTRPVVEAILGSEVLDGLAVGTVDADGTLHPEAGIGTADGAFTYTKALTGTPGACETIDNTATITQTAQSDDASVQLCIVKGVTASKSGAGTFTRTYPWTVTKDVEDTVIEVKPDGTATFNYTVTAHQGTPVDSAHVLAATVTVTISLVARMTAF